MTLTVSQNLPPVPSAMKLAQGDMVTQPWQQWFVNLTAKVNQINAVIVAISGSGSTSGAFNTLSPLTANGDLLTYSASNNIRLGIGTAGQVLTVVSGMPAWTTPTEGSGGILPVVTGDINNSQPTFVYLDNGSLVYVQVQ